MQTGQLTPKQISPGEWIEVEFDTQEISERQRIGGANVELLVSFYDIPLAVRGFYSREKDRLVVEFKYINPSDESYKEKQHDDNVSLFLGANSNRLYRIELDVKALKVSPRAFNIVIAKVDEVVDRLTHDPKTKERRNSYQLARKAVKYQQKRLFNATSLSA